MRLVKNCRFIRKIACLALLLLPEVVGAQTYFTNNQYGDVLLGFRKESPTPGTNELVVDIGNVTNLVGLAPGTTINITAYPTSVLTDSFSTGTGNLQWSAFTTFPLSSSWVTPIGTYPKATLWYTVPSTATNVQSTPFARSSVSGQQTTRQKMLGVGSGATAISTAIGTTNVDNNSVLVREPIGTQYVNNNNLSVFIADSGNVGDFDTQIVVENITSNTFTSPVRSDFYQACPTTLVDPITGQTSGNAYFVGYFIFNPSGTMTFTRAPVALPPAPVLTITRTNTTSTISFGTTNGGTYNLIYTTLSGLSTARSTWTPAAGSITGTGGTTNFTDTTTDPGRVYSVTVH